MTWAEGSDRRAGSEPGSFAGGGQAPSNSVAAAMPSCAKRVFDSLSDSLVPPRDFAVTRAVS